MTKVDCDKQRYEMADLLDIMAALRAPDGGCPWDQEQSFKTIVPYTIEEAYEVAEAIETGDLAHLRHELGDLLFQVVFYAQMAREEGRFDFGDVVDGICRKMIRRHPHVFDGTTAGSHEQLKQQWDAIKRQEAEENGRASTTGDEPMRTLDGAPLALPSMTRAVMLQDKAAAVGFDWGDIGPVFDKMQEELGELQAEIEKDRANPRIQEEFGDVLFVLANVARHLGLDPEQALRLTNAKFERRFRKIEDILHEKGKRPQDSGLAEMDALWTQIKQAEKTKS